MVRRGRRRGGKKPPPVTPHATAPVGDLDGGASRPPSPPEPIVEPTIVPPEPVRDDRISSASLDDLNRNSPLKPVFFELDSAEVVGRRSGAARRQRRHPQTLSDVGGDDRRSLRRTRDRRVQSGLGRAARASRPEPICVSLGIPADRLRTVSYGKEFPFDPGHDEAAFSKNRRAHFVITAK